MGADGLSEPKAKTIRDLDFVFGPEILDKLDFGYTIVEMPDDGQLRLIAPAQQTDAA